MIESLLYFALLFLVWHVLDLTCICALMGLDLFWHLWTFGFLAYVASSFSFLLLSSFLLCMASLYV